MSTRSLQSGQTWLPGNGTSPVRKRRSRLPFRRAVVKPVFDRSAVTSSIAGKRRLKSSNVARKLPADIDVQNPTRRYSGSHPPLDVRVFIRASICSRIVLAARKTFRPAGVSLTPLLERSNSIIPMDCSKCLIDLLSAEWRTESSSAARRKLPQSAAATADRR